MSQSRLRPCLLGSSLRVIAWAVFCLGCCALAVDEPFAPGECRFECSSSQYQSFDCACIECASLEGYCAADLRSSVCGNLARYGYCADMLRAANVTRPTTTATSTATTTAATTTATSIAATTRRAVIEQPTRDVTVASSSGTMATIAVATVAVLIVIIAAAAGVLVSRWRNRRRKNRSGNSSSDGAVVVGGGASSEDGTGTDDGSAASLDFGGVGCRKTTEPLLPPEGSVSMFGRSTCFAPRSSQDLRPDSPAPDIPPAGSMRSGPACRGRGVGSVYGRFPLLDWHASMPALPDSSKVAPRAAP